MSARFPTRTVFVVAIAAAVLAAAVAATAVFLITPSSGLSAEALMPNDIEGASTQTTPASEGAASRALATHEVTEAVAATVATDDGPTPLHLLSVAGSRSAMDDYVAEFELLGAAPPALSDESLAATSTDFDDISVGEQDALLRTASAPNGDRIDGLVRVTPENVIVATSTDGDRDAVTKALRSMIATA